MRCIPENAECAQVLIGSMRNLSRPIMAFVRLSEGQMIGKMKEEKKSFDQRLFDYFRRNDGSTVASSISIFTHWPSNGRIFGNRSSSKHTFQHTCKKENITMTFLSE